MAKRNYNIDVIKALAIVSVILIHGLSNESLYAILAPYYIWQTVPVFMILVGYNSANSFIKRDYTTLSDIFSQHYLMKKAKRILLPFAFIWLAQVLLQYLYFDNTEIPALIRSFIVGGYGPGSYFVPLIVQATILTPLLYVLLKKRPMRMMIVLFIVSLLADYGTFWLGVSGSLYRLLIVRHVFSLTLGVWYALAHKDLRLKWLLIPAGISLIYITAVHYFNWELILEEFWHSQHAPSYFYVLVLIIIGVKFMNITKESLIEKTFILIGQSSFHIFLTQMIYFWFVHKAFPEFNGFLYIALFLTVPIAAGIGFHSMDNYLNRTFSS